MKEALKIINECLFFKLHKVERIGKLNNLRKMLYSEFGIHHNMSKLFDLLDDISLMIISKKYYDHTEPISVYNINLGIEKEIIEKFTQLRNSILDILIDRGSIIFFDKLLTKKPNLLQRMLYSFLSYFFQRYKIQ